MSLPLSASQNVDQANISQEIFEQCDSNNPNLKKQQQQSYTECCGDWFRDARFVDITLYRIIQKQKVPYGDLCQLSMLNRQYGRLARRGLTCASPRKLDDMPELKEKYGNQLNAVDMSGSKSDISKENLALIPTYFPNINLVKISTTYFHMWDEWIQQAPIQTLLQCTTKINAKLLMVDSIKICDVDGMQFVEDWAATIMKFLQHIKKYWKSISITFRFFRLESLFLVLKQVRDLCEEGVFEISVTIILTMEYLFKQLGSETIITDKQFQETKQLLSSSKIISKVMINIDMFHKNLEAQMFEDLVDTLKSSPCTSDTIHFAFSRYVITWLNGGTDHFTCSRNPFHLSYRKDLFKNKLLMHIEIQDVKLHNNHRQIGKQFLERHKEQWIGGLEVLNIRNYRWMAAKQLVKYDYIRFLHIEFNCFQLKKFTQQDLFSGFKNLLILSLVSKDYEADSETLNAFLRQFGHSLQKIQAFHFFQDVDTREDDVLDTTFLQYMRGAVIIDLFCSKWSMDIDKFIEQIKNFRYLDSINLRIKCDVKQLGEDIYDHISAQIADSVPRLRFATVSK
eukprot:TRINITY_DN1468_c0_g1_i1.p1 TRINITY_DN1468_c0_g1~~TRINITY_DN1468_c0_g1_i1.p1  ORF type:complete len:566 (+),score=33.27 TRINITY_DN1468_c0_g1_i1:274-1971(+)